MQPSQKELDIISNIIKYYEDKIEDLEKENVKLNIKYKENNNKNEKNELNILDNNKVKIEN